MHTDQLDDYVVQGFEPSMFTVHTYLFPITPINPLLPWSSVSRTSIAGAVLGADERVTPLEGLRALTIDAAHEHRTEADLGSVGVGRLADLAVLDADPLTVDVDAIAGIAVLRTYERGVVVHDAE